MKLKITQLGNDPTVTIEIEDDPEACAAFLAAFERHRLLPGKLERKEPAETAQRISQDPPRISQDSPRNSQDSPRTYGGKPNRRHMVLSALQKLASIGNKTPTLDDIRTCYSELFPMEPVKHLDQVVRDLTNKTDWVERLEWGTFRLRSSNPEGS